MKPKSIYHRVRWVGYEGLAWILPFPLRKKYREKARYIKEKHLKPAVAFHGTKIIFHKNFYGKQKKTSFKNGVRLLGNNFVENHVEIDAFSYVSRNSIVSKNTKIGKYCSIAHNVSIGLGGHPTNYLSTYPLYHAAPTSFDSYPETIVGHDVWIGAHAMIMGGVKVGNGAIVGAGALVTRDVPPYAIVVGVPAKVLRHRFDAETIEKIQATEWWNRSSEKLSKLPISDVNACLKILSEQ